MTSRVVSLPEQERVVEILKDDNSVDKQVVQGSSSQAGGNIEREAPQWPGAPEEDSFGLFQLWPDPDVEGQRKIKTDVDVIAIHGLGGHPMKTWQSGERVWLRDFLPTDLRTARIFTFGYNSGFAFTNSKSRIRDFAKQLLEKLVQLRMRTKIENRKMIFVCHSLGGIVLKQSIIMANERGRYSAVGKNIAGVIFLGTPHRGSDIAFWGKTLGKFANFAVFGGIRTDLLNSLTPKSTELSDISAQFVERAVPLQIFSIYERLKIKGLPDLVVDETSAILGLPNETSCPMETDHNGLCKYLTSSSQNYIVVRDYLTELFDLVVDEASVSVPGLMPHQKNFVQRLAHLSAEDPLNLSQYEWGRNSDWLLQHDEFRTWRDIHGGCKALWLHGLPGSGKTVLAKQVVSFLQRESEEELSTSLVRKTLHFFFDDKDPKRRTNESLIASILFQLLTDPRTCFVAKYIGDDVVDRFHLEIDVLWECFASVVYRSRGILFFLVIDALDEMERERGQTRQHVLNQLSNIAANDLSGHLRIFVTDRQVRPFQFEQVISSKQIDVENEATRKDIEIFIATKVRSKLEANYLSKERAKHIETELIAISEGNFLRATLTWRQFDRKVENWSTDAVRKELDALHILPPGLDVFYFEILDSIPVILRPEARKAFSAIMVAIEPLSIRQLAFLTVLPETDVKNSTRVFYSPDDFMEFFERYCAHILKLDDNNIVSFTHQTVKELLSSTFEDSERAAILAQFQMPTSDAHNLMLKQCIRVLTLEAHQDHHWPLELALIAQTIQDQETKIREPVVSRRLEEIGTTPCLRYAVYHWMSHYRDATKDNQLDHEVATFLMRQSTSYYCKIWELSQEFDILVIRHKVDFSIEEPAAPLFHIIQRGDFPALVRTLVKRRDTSDFMGHETILSPLTWSIICRRKQSFMVMLNSGLVNVNVQEDGRWTPTHQAVTCEDLFFLRALVRNDVVDVNVRGDGEAAPLHRAIRERKYEAALVLLDLPSINIRRASWYGTPYDLAIVDPGAEKVAMRLIQIMEEREYASISQHQFNPLRIAGSLGWTRMMDMVIQKNSLLVGAIDESGLSPLTWHAYYGEKTQLHWVLQFIPDGMLNPDTDFGKYNLVSLCAHQGWQDTTEMLINQFGLQAPDSDHLGRNLLHWAIYYGWELGENDISTYSTDQINQQDRDGSTPLHLAILSRGVDVIKLLVSRGASCIVKDHRGFTPAHLAADSGFRAALQIFIESPHREFGRTREGASLLHHIASWFDAKTIHRFIVAKRPLLDCRDRKGRTPLHYAATVDNTSAVETLIKHGASIDQWDQDGRTALHDALRSGGSDAVMILLKNGADTTRLDNFSQSCLQLSARYGHESLGKLMMRLNHRIDAGDMFGMTALHRACASGIVSLIELLLKGNADWTRTDRFLDTPLDKAVIRGQTAAVQYFLGWLWDNAVHEKTFQTVMNNALDHALREENANIQRMLKGYGARPTGQPIVIWRPYVPEEKRSSYWPLVTYASQYNYPLAPEPDHPSISTYPPTSSYPSAPPYIPTPAGPPEPPIYRLVPTQRPGDPPVETPGSNPRRRTSPPATRFQPSGNDSSENQRPRRKKKKKPSKLDRPASFMAGTH